ncbi:MAG: metal-sensing transcriptional repressor [Rubrivivax sp.]|nr:metal-sensing transcriptional repressor [Rubrivivax sp.]
MAENLDARARNDLLNRLKRAEGQLRGVQRMIEEGQPAHDVANQMSAVRKALDSTHTRLTVCYLKQRLHQTLGLDDTGASTLEGVLEEAQPLLAKAH